MAGKKEQSGKGIEHSKEYFLDFYNIHKGITNILRLLGYSQDTIKEAAKNGTTSEITAWKELYDKIRLEYKNKNKKLNWLKRNGYIKKVKSNRLVVNYEGILRSMEPPHPSEEEITKWRKDFPGMIIHNKELPPSVEESMPDLIRVFQQFIDLYAAYEPKPTLKGLLHRFKTELALSSIKFDSDACYYFIDVCRDWLIVEHHYASPLLDGLPYEKHFKSLFYG